jgi:hypothetical protein
MTLLVTLSGTGRSSWLRLLCLGSRHALVLPALCSNFGVYNFDILIKGILPETQVVPMVTSQENF